MEIYAELSLKMLQKIENGGNLNLPYGVILNRRKGSRACYFECDNKDTLIEFLEDQQIPWQFNDQEPKKKKEKKVAKKYDFLGE